MAEENRGEITAKTKDGGLVIDNVTFNVMDRVKPYLAKQRNNKLKTFNELLFQMFVCSLVIFAFNVNINLMGRMVGIIVTLLWGGSWIMRLIKC